MGSVWEELREGDHDQCILYEKLFSIKRYMLKAKVNQNPFTILKINKNY